VSKPLFSTESQMPNQKASPQSQLPVLRDMLLGLFFALLVVLLLLWSGSEDRSFIYIDF
jgi:flagellar biogenesis protein FliO